MMCSKMGKRFGLNPTFSPSALRHIISNPLLKSNPVPKSFSAYSRVVPCLRSRKPDEERNNCWRYGQQKRFLNSDENKVKVKRFYALGPMKWLDLKAKMFLMRSFFDREFDEEEFLEGAKQAICLVSSKISQQMFEKLSGLLSDKAKDDARDIYANAGNKNNIKINEEDIEVIRVNNMGFIYDEKGKKWADILVTCFCTSEETVSKTIGNIDIVGLPSQRVFHFAFVREFTPGVTADWIVDRIEMFKSA